MKFFTSIIAALGCSLPVGGFAAAYDVTVGDRGFLREVVAAVERKDTGWIVAHSLIPMAVKERGETRIADKEELMRLVKLSLTDDFAGRFRSNAEKPLFKNWQGVMVGDGILWFEQVKRHEDEPWSYAILAFGGFAFQPSPAPDEEERPNRPPTATFKAGVNMPTSRSSFSPDLRWQVRCETTKQPDGFLHTVYLSRTGSGKEEAVWQATRSCNVLWSEGGEALAITDWTGSSLSEIQIVDLPTAKARRLDVAGVEKLIQKDELEGHCYYEALHWESSRRLQIRIFGHTDENPSHDFAYYFSVDIESGRARLIKKEDQEPGRSAEPLSPSPRASS